MAVRHLAEWTYDRKTNDRIDKRPKKHLTERAYRRKDKWSKNHGETHIWPIRILTKLKYTGMKKSIINPLHRTTFGCQRDHRMTQIQK